MASTQENNLREKSLKRKMADLRSRSASEDDDMDTEDFVAQKQQKKKINTASKTEFELPLSNRWGVFSQTEKDTTNPPSEETETVQEITVNKTVSKHKIPPIIIPGAPVDYKTIRSQVKAVLNHDNFRIYANTRETRITVFNDEDRKKLMNNLKADVIPFYSYSSKSERTKKIVLKACPNMDTAKIKEELDQKGILRLQKAKKQKPVLFLISN